MGNTGRDHVEAALAAQNSLFYTYQKLIRIAQKLPVIVYGKYQVIETEETECFSISTQFKNKKILSCKSIFLIKRLLFQSVSIVSKQVFDPKLQKKITNNLLPYEAFSAPIY